MQPLFSFVQLQLLFGVFEISEKPEIRRKIANFKTGIILYTERHNESYGMTIITFLLVTLQFSLQTSGLSPLYRVHLSNIQLKS